MTHTHFDCVCKARILKSHVSLVPLKKPPIISLAFRTRVNIYMYIYTHIYVCVCVCVCVCMCVCVCVYIYII